MTPDPKSPAPALRPVNIISLGAGVQSSTMALMAAEGLLTPMPEAAIFSDTGNERKKVYEWLRLLEPMLPFPVIRVFHPSGLKLSERSLIVRTSKHGNRYSQSAIPVFIGGGLQQRQCTRDFKIDLISRAARAVAKGRRITQWIGISLDECIRMKPSQKRMTTNIFPLIDLKMTRSDCKRWCAERGLYPPKSSCIFCPFHDNSQWASLSKEELAEAAAYERALQETYRKTRMTGIPFLHRSCVPIDQVDFSLPAFFGEAWGNECEGACGV